jgi:PQQ-dependent dehydrogenase (methanol/ethanol family)
MKLLRPGSDLPGEEAPARHGRGASVTAWLVVAMMAMTLASCQRRPSDARGPASARALGGSVKGDPATLAQDDGQWVMPAKNYASTRFSGLNEINTQNVSHLGVSWTFSTGMVAGHEAAPLVVGDTMFVVTPFPNIVYAFDLTRPGAPMKWHYDPEPLGAAKGVACCDLVNRGAAYADGKIFFNTLDGRTIALDAATGRPTWITQLADINKGETMTMAPLVVKGKVLVGNSGGEFGVRGWLVALDAATGAVVWRAYSTGPDKDVLIGPNFKPFYPSDRGADLGITTWPGEGWRTGGGTVWGWISYDPELDLIYYGTANPGPWNPAQRPGDNKWTAGVFARRPDTGEAIWYYQTSPHDLFDHDSVNELVLADVKMGGGAVRKLALRADRNGLLYALDRTTGEVLSAAPFGFVNSNRGVDMKTGRLIPVKEKEPTQGVVVRDVCPAAPGMKDWQPTSFSPRTGLLYIPHQNLCEDVEAMTTSYIAGTPYVGASVVYKAGPGGHRGVVTAWDPAAAKPAWTIDETFPVWSGTVVTAGDVLFYGTMDGWFKAVNATNGEPLWQFKCGSGVIGQPVVYKGPDGHEYVAVLAGVGGWAGALVSNDLDPRDATAGNGWGAALADLKAATTRGGMLYVFALGGGR